MFGDVRRCSAMFGDVRECLRWKEGGREEGMVKRITLPCGASPARARREPGASLDD